MKKFLITATLLFFVLTSEGFPFTVESIPLHLKLTRLTEQKRPEFYGNSIVFSFKPQIQTRFVGVAFKHEDFTVIHPFLYNEHGVFFCVVPVPLGESEVLYRFVADGLWLNDPANPETVSDGRGSKLSILKIPREREVKKEYPYVDSGRFVEFIYQGPQGRFVTVEGSFNHWDPFMHELKEKSPGFYSLRLRLPEGRSYYRFVVNGNPIPDTGNRLRAIDANGREVSEIVVVQ